MAKWGEGDPRWLVAHRDDGKNVGSWHWEETSKRGWSKQRLGELLTGLAADIAPERGSLTITGVKEATGEASITTRKGNKKLALFDLHIIMAYEGQLAGSDKKIKGEYKVDEFSNANDEDEYIFSATVEGTGSEQDECKRIVEGMQEKVAQQLRQFVQEINEL